MIIKNYVIIFLLIYNKYLISASVIINKVHSFLLAELESLF